MGVDGIGRLPPGLLHEHAQRVITQRIAESIEISIAFEDDAVVLHCSFRFAEEDERRELDVIIGAVSVEVVSE